MAMDGLSLRDYLYLDSYDSEEEAREAIATEHKLFNCVIVNDGGEFDVYATE